MNGIEELRRTLETHAGDAEGVGGVDRSAAIRTRVRAVRRRRAVGAAVAAVAVLAGGLALLPGGHDGRPDPAGPTVFGIDVPGELESLGYTYDYVDHVRGEDRVRLELEASDSPRLVSWATTAGDDRVVVDAGSGAGPLVSEGDDFADWTYVAPGDGSTVTARAEGDLALAVYTLGEARPDGVTADGVTYRDTRAGAPLLGAAIGEPGQAEVVVEPTGRAATVFYSYYCVDGPANAYLHVEIATGEFISGGCRLTDAAIDPAAGGGASQRAEPGQDLTTRLYVTAGPNGPLVDSDSLRIGIGLYAEPATRDAGDGVALPEEVEHDGHLWTLVETAAPEVGPLGATADVPALGERGLMLLSYRGGRDTLASYAVEGQQIYDAMTSGGGTFTAELDPGAPTASLVTGGRGAFPATTRVGFGFYVRAD